MYKKTRYRRFKDGGAVSAPLHVEIDTPQAHVAADKATADLLPAIESATTIPDVQDDASRAFQLQIDALRRSEQIQRDRAAQAASPKSSREETLQRWRDQGMTDGQADFLRTHQHMIDEPERLRKASEHATQMGHQVDTPTYYAAIASKFAEAEPEKLSRLEPRTIPPKEGMLVLNSPTMPDRSRFVSAPVSRESYANGSLDASGNRPGSVRLSVAQKEAARYAGISEVEYAKNLLRLREEKEAGNYGGQP
jgi:hypothetical protein